MQSPGYLKTLARLYVLYLVAGAALLPAACLYALDASRPRSLATTTLTFAIGLVFAHSAWNFTSPRIGQRVEERAAFGNLSFLALLAALVAFLALTAASASGALAPETTASGARALLEFWSRLPVVARGVAVIVLTMSAYSIGVGVERVVVLNRDRAAASLYVPRIEMEIKEGHLGEAIALSRSASNRHSQLARIVLAGLEQYESLRGKEASVSREELTAAVHHSISQASELSARELSRGVPALAIVATAAPIIGLLGTVVGIVTAFQRIGASGSTESIAVVASAVAEALSSTALGLLAAIPAVLFHQYLRQRIEYFNVESTRSSMALYHLPGMAAVPE